MIATRDGARLPVTNCSPSEALKRLKANMEGDGERLEWLARAKVEAILGSCPRSLKSVASGMRAWIAFADEVLGMRGREYPPSLSALLAWSLIFRSSATFSNYLGYARIGCALAGLSCDAFDSPELKRAKVAIDKRGGFRKRPRMFIRLEVVQSMVQCFCDGRLY